MTEISVVGQSVEFAKHRKSPFWWVGYVPAVCGLVFFGWLTVVLGGSVLIPLLLGFAITFMLEPLALRLEAKGFSHNIAVLLTLLIALAVVAAALVLLLPSIFHQLRESVDKLPLAIRAAAARLQDLLGIAQQRLSPEMFSRLRDQVSSFEANPTALTSKVGSWLSSGALGLISLGSAALGLVIVPFFVYYLLLDLNNLKLIVEKQIPERYRGLGLQLFHEIGQVVRGYVRGRFLIACIMATMYAIGLLILRVPLWAGIGLIAGVIGIIPYLGVTSGILLALGFAALDGAGFGRLIGVLVVFFIAQMTEDYVLTPKIIGGKLELHPMLVFLALIVAGDLYGLLGLVLAIPALAILKVLVRFLEQFYIQSDFYLAPGPPVRKNIDSI